MRVVLTEEADADMAAIFFHLADEAGGGTAEKYLGAFYDVYERLAVFPGLGAARPELGRAIHMCVVSPYLILYRLSDAEVSILRLVHGRRNVTRELIGEE